MVHQSLPHQFWTYCNRSIPNELQNYTRHKAKVNLIQRLRYHYQDKHHKLCFLPPNVCSLLSGRTDPLDQRYFLEVSLACESDFAESDLIAIFGQQCFTWRCPTLWVSLSLELCFLELLVCAGSLQDFSRCLRMCKILLLVIQLQGALEIGSALRLIRCFRRYWVRSASNLCLIFSLDCLAANPLHTSQTSLCNCFVWT